MRLYHFTCEHGKRGVTRRGWLHPNPHPLLGWYPLLWLTSVEAPTRQQVGLFSTMLDCDRMAFRYVVNTAVDVESWEAWARRNDITEDIRGELEMGCDPATWFVSARRQFAVLDRSWSPAQAEGK